MPQLSTGGPNVASGCSPIQIMVVFASAKAIYSVRYSPSVHRRTLLYSRRAGYSPTLADSRHSSCPLVDQRRISDAIAVRQCPPMDIRQSWPVKTAAICPSRTSIHSAVFNMVIENFQNGMFVLYALLWNLSYRIRIFAVFFNFTFGTYTNVQIDLKTFIHGIFFLCLLHYIVLETVLSLN